MNKRLPIILALVIAALLRFVALGDKPLWCDELATLQRLSLPLAEHFRQMGGNHPLYEILLRFWMPPDGSDAWMRIPSAVMGVLAVWLTWRLVRRWGATEGLLAAWLLAISPLHLMFSRIARAYSLACALALLSNLALLHMLRRRNVASAMLYVAATVLMVASNLFAVSMLVAQVLFMVWSERERLRRFLPFLAGALVLITIGALAILRGIPGAWSWGLETRYTAGQLGLLAKACYLPLTFCLGETVHPLSLWVVLPAFIGFGGAMAVGTWQIVRARSDIGMFLLLQVAALYLFGLFFPAAASKHMLIILPAWCGIVAVGLAACTKNGRAMILAALILGTTALSLMNYFSNREFADADMVTPWREMAARVQSAEQPGDALIVGYRMDRGVYDMFCRYYTGRIPPHYLQFADWQADLSNALRGRRPVWLLLHDGDPWPEIEAWLKTENVSVTMYAYQMEEHTLRGLREGLGSAGKYRSPLYRLYRIE